MKKLAIILTTLLVLSIIFTAIGCGGDDDEELTPTQAPTQAPTTPAPTVTQEPDATATEPSATATPEPPVYTGGEHTFKVSHSGAIDGTTGKRWAFTDERLQYYTNGKVKIETYPGNALYQSLEEWGAIVTGAIDLLTMGEWQFQFAGFVDFQLPWLNFFWGETAEEQFEHSERFWSHPDGGKKMYAQVERAGAVILGRIPSIGRQLVFGDFELKSIHDLSGKKQASTGGLPALFVDYGGATQVMLDPTEWVVALQQGLIDVMAYGPETVVNFKLYRDVCCGLLMDVLDVNTYWTMNLDLWNGLEPELQDIIQNKVIPEVVEYQLRTAPVDNERNLGILEEEGMIISIVSPEERLEVRDATWEMAQEEGYLGLIDQDLLKLADHLRSEPYDHGYFFL